MSQKFPKMQQRNFRIRRIGEQVRKVFDQDYGCPQFTLFSQVLYFISVGISNKKNILRAVSD